MPNKRYVKRSVTFLDAEEIAALLAAPERTTWVGRRDHVLLVLALQTGLRASELINLRCKEVVLGTGAHLALDTQRTNACGVPFVPGQAHATAQSIQHRERF